MSLGAATTQFGTPRMFPAEVVIVLGMPRVFLGLAMALLGTPRMLPVGVVTLPTSRKGLSA
jgi:hypothetical protein